MFWNEDRMSFGNVHDMEGDMRKKSHISLAGYLVRELGLEELANHKMAFYLGSILPDLNPGMVREPHEFSVTYGKLQESIYQVIEDGAKDDYKERVMWRRLGVIMHYLADYFTFPHNTSYEGNLKDHCLYERDMKYWMRDYVRTPEAMVIFRRQRTEAAKIRDVDELFGYIEDTHWEYMRASHTAEDDCRWILSLCSTVLIAVAAMIREGQKASAALRYRCA